MWFKMIKTKKKSQKKYKTKIKSTAIKCEICNVSSANQTEYNTHIKGKKHIKKLALKPFQKNWTGWNEIYTKNSKQILKLQNSVPQLKHNVIENLFKNKYLNRIRKRKKKRFSVLRKGRKLKKNKFPIENIESIKVPADKIDQGKNFFKQNLNSE